MVPRDGGIPRVLGQGARSVGNLVGARKRYPYPNGSFYFVFIYFLSSGGLVAIELKTKPHLHV